jgi:hypothetical protein
VTPRGGGGVRRASGREREGVGEAGGAQDMRYFLIV